MKPVGYILIEDKREFEKSKFFEILFCKVYSYLTIDEFLNIIFRIV